MCSHTVKMCMLHTRICVKDSSHKNPRRLAFAARNSTGGTRIRRTRTPRRSIRIFKASVCRRRTAKGVSTAKPSSPARIRSRQIGNARRTFISTWREKSTASRRKCFSRARLSMTKTNCFWNSARAEQRRLGKTCRRPKTSKPIRWSSISTSCLIVVESGETFRHALPASPECSETTLQRLKQSLRVWDTDRKR